MLSTSKSSLSWFQRSNEKWVEFNETLHQYQQQVVVFEHKFFVCMFKAFEALSLSLFASAVAVVVFESETELE